MMNPQRALFAAAVILFVLIASGCSKDYPQPDLRATITALEAQMAVPEAQAAAPVSTPTPEVVYVTVVVTPTPTPIPTPPPESAVIDPAVVEALVMDLVNAESGRPLG